MGLFGNSRYKGKSDYYIKIDKMLINEVTSGFDGVMSVHNEAFRRKKARNDNWYKERLDKKLQEFESVIKQLLVELNPLKSKNKVIYSEIQSDLAAVKKDLKDADPRELMSHLKQLGEVYKKIRKYVETLQ